MYIFEKAEVAEDFFMASSRICNIYDFDADYIKNRTLLLGKLKKSFGEPAFLTDNLEEQFEYFIKATNEKGDHLILEVYSGSSGPAIGGLRDHSSEVAARELALFIQQLKSFVDYDYEGYYLDGPCKVRCGIKDGEPYWDESEISMDELNKLLIKLGFSNQS